MSKTPKFKPYTHPFGGWHSVKAVAATLLKERVVSAGAPLFMHQNKPDGFAGVSCSWAKLANPHPFEFCEQGAKATAWEITSRSVAPEFFQQHTVGALRPRHSPPIVIPR